MEHLGFVLGFTFPPETNSSNLKSGLLEDDLHPFGMASWQLRDVILRVGNSHGNGTTPQFVMVMLELSEVQIGC